MMIGTNQHQLIEQNQRWASALVVEDCNFDRIKLRRLLVGINKNFIFHELSSLEGLEDILDRWRFDIAFTDFDLPNGNGFDVIKKLKESERNFDTDCIMISGSNSHEIRLRALKLNCVAYLSKNSLDQELLMKWVNTILSVNSPQE